VLESKTDCTVEDLIRMAIWDKLSSPQGYETRCPTSRQLGSLTH
jgi:hypothetical protein